MVYFFLCVLAVVSRSSFYWFFGFGFFHHQSLFTVNGWFTFLLNLFYADFSPSGLVVYLLVNMAVMTKLDCSFKWVFLLPSDGDAIVDRPIKAGLISFPLITLEAVMRRSCTYCQQPMFLGSS